MKGKQRLISLFLRPLPGRYKKSAAKLFIYAGREGKDRPYLALTTVISIIVPIALLLLWIPFREWILLVLAVLSVPIIHAIFYLVFYFKMIKRTEKIEHYLPDVLQLIAANVRSGMTPFQALRFSARDEFGDLKKEIEYVTTKGLGTENFSQAMLGIKNRINSKVLERAIQLFVSSMRSGAHLAKILEESARDISENRILKNDMSTNTKTYTMFILFIVTMGTPFLLVISIKFLEMITEIQAKTTGRVGFGMSFLMSNVTITPEFLFYVALVMLVVTALSASMMVGVINSGKMKYGFKYFPFIALGTVAIFFISRFLIEYMGFF